MVESGLFEDLWDSYSVKVVIIDDDPHSVDLVQRYIKKSYPHVECFGTSKGSIGLELIESKIPDLIILDIEMPEMSGLEVLQKIKSHASKDIKTIPVIMVTVVNDRKSISKAVEQGAVNYLLKPYDKKELTRRIKPYLLA